MRIYEIGLLRNDELLLSIKYHNEDIDKLDKEWWDHIHNISLEIINGKSKYRNQIVSTEILDIHISMIGNKNGEKSKFVSYIISSNDLSIETKKKILNKLLNVFFKKYPAPICYNINKKVFNGFSKKVDKIVGDLSMNPSGRLLKAFENKQ